MAKIQATIAMKDDIKRPRIRWLPESSESMNQARITSNTMVTMYSSPTSLMTKSPVSSVAGPLTFQPYGKRYIQNFS